MRAFLLLVGVGLCWALTPAWVLGIESRESIVVVRSLGTAAGLLLLQKSAFRNALTASRANLWMMLRAGSFAALSTVLFPLAFYVAPAGVVYSLYYSFPGLSYFLEVLEGRRRPKALDVAVIIVGFVGVIESVDLSTVSFLGLVVGLGSALSWIAFIRSSRRLSDDAQVGTGMILGNLAFGALASPLLLMSHPALHARSLLCLAGLVASSVAAMFMWNKAVRHVETHEAGIFTTLEVPLGMSLVAWITGQNVPLNVWLGLALVLSSASFLFWRAHRAVMTKAEVF